MMVGGFSVFGFSNMIVAAEGFFIFGGWFGLRVASSLGEHKSKRMMDFRDGMAIGAGLCGGVPAAYLLLTTPEGQAITKWATNGTTRIIGSLFVSVMGLGIFESVWRKLSSLR